MHLKLLQQVMNCLQEYLATRQPSNSALILTPVPVYVDGRFAVERDDEIWNRCGVYLFTTCSGPDELLRYVGRAANFTRRLGYSSARGTFRHEKYAEASAGGTADIYLIPLSSDLISISESELITRIHPNLNITYNPSVIVSRATARAQEMLRRVRVAETGIFFTSAASGLGYRAAESALGELIGRGLVRVQSSLSKCNMPCRVLHATGRSWQ